MINAPILKTKDVAEKLQIHTHTVWKLVKDGKLKAYKYGKGFRFFNEDVQAYIQSTKKESTIDFEE